MTKKTQAQSSVNSAFTFFWYCLYLIKENPLWFLFILSHLMTTVKAAQADKTTLIIQDNENNDVARVVPINDFTRQYFGGDSVSSTQLYDTKIQDVQLINAVHFGSQVYDILLTQNPNENTGEVTELNKKLKVFLNELKESQIDPNIILKTAVKNSYVVHEDSEQLTNFFHKIKKLYDAVLANDRAIEAANQYNAAYYIGTQQPQIAVSKARRAFKANCSIENERLYGIANFFSDSDNSYSVRNNQFDSSHNQLFNRLLDFVDRRLFNRLQLTGQYDTQPDDSFELINTLMREGVNRYSITPNNPYFNFYYNNKVLAELSEKPINSIMPNLTTILYVDPLNTKAIALMLKNTNENLQLTFSLYRYLILLASDNEFYSMDSENINDAPTQNSAIQSALKFLESNYAKLKIEWFLDKRFEESFVLAKKRAEEEDRGIVLERLRNYRFIEERYLQRLHYAEKDREAFWDITLKSILLMAATINFMHPSYFYKGIDFFKNMASKTLTLSIRLLLKFPFIKQKLTSIFLSSSNDTTPSLNAVADNSTPLLQDTLTKEQYQNFLDDIIIYRQAFLAGINTHHPYVEILLNTTNEIMIEFVDSLETFINENLAPYQEDTASTLEVSRSEQTLTEHRNKIIEELTTLAIKTFPEFVAKKQAKAVDKIQNKFFDIQESMRALKEKLKFLDNQIAKYPTINIDLTAQFKTHTRIKNQLQKIENEFNYVENGVGLNENAYQTFSNIAFFVDTYLNENLEKIQYEIKELNESWNSKKRSYEEKFHKIQLQKKHEQPSNTPKKEKLNLGSDKSKNPSRIGNKEIHQVKHGKLEKINPSEFTHTPTNENSDENLEPIKPENSGSDKSKTDKNIKKSTLLSKPGKLEKSAPLKQNSLKNVPQKPNLPQPQAMATNDNNSNNQPKPEEPQSHDKVKSHMKFDERNHLEEIPSQSTSATYTIKDLQNDNALLRLKQVYESITLVLKNMPDKSTIESQPILFYGLMANIMWLYSAAHVAGKRFSSLANLINPKDAAEMKNIIFYRRLSFYTLDDLSSFLDITHTLMKNIQIFMSASSHLPDIALAEKISRYVADNHTINHPITKPSLKETMYNLLARISHLESIYKAQNDVTAPLQSAAKCLAWTTIAQEIYALPNGLKTKILQKLNLILTNDPMDDTQLESFRNANRHVKLDNRTIITGNIEFKINNYFGIIGEKADNMTIQLFSDEKALKTFLAFLKNVIKTCKETTPGITNFHKPSPPSQPDFDPNANNNNNAPTLQK